MLGRLRVVGRRKGVEKGVGVVGCWFRGGVDVWRDESVGMRWLSGVGGGGGGGGGSGGGGSAGSGGGGVLMPKVEVVANQKESILEHRDHPYLTGNARYLPGYSIPAPRKLEQIVKYALLARESPPKIVEIWSKFHADRTDAIGTILTASQHDAFTDIARRNPFFVYPIPKGKGKFFTLLGQWQDRHVIFTYLEDYKKDPVRAEPYLSLTLYDDFKDKKGLVLVRGDFSGHLTKKEAVRVVAMWRHFYLKDTQPIKDFNHNPEHFDFNKLIADTTAE